jgi:glycosyltransferase involved in cell wall biosynthesis
MRSKVLFVITKGSWGGAGRYLYDLSIALQDEYDVVVATGGTGLLEQKLKQRHIRTRIVPNLARDMHATKDVWALYELYKVFRAERPDIVHLNSSKAGAIGALAARLAGVPRIVFTVHGWAFNEPVSRIAKAFRWVASLVTMLLSHKTITVSHFDMLLSPLGLHSQTIHNGIAEIAFHPRTEARQHILKRAGIPEDAFVFGTIAELHTNKGIDLLIQAAYLVDDVHVVVIGEGEERKALEALIADLDLGHRVHLIGFIDEAYRYLKAFDVFVLPSRKEGLPYAILEAGQAGVPVIAAAVGGVPEIVSDQISGDLVHAFNDLPLAESMKEFYTSPNTIQHYADALKARVERYFTVHDMVRKTRDVYES